MTDLETAEGHKDVGLFSAEGEVIELQKNVPPNKVSATKVSLTEGNPGHAGAYIDVRETEYANLATIQGRAPGTPRRYLAQETGPRSSVVCVMPFDGGAKGSHGLALYDLEMALVKGFGGFTRSKVVGAWDNQSAIMFEPAIRYEVSFKPSRISASDAQHLFATCGKACDQTWVHIEYREHAFEALHVKVNSGAAYDNS